MENVKYDYYIITYSKIWPDIEEEYGRIIGITNRENTNSLFFDSIGNYTKYERHFDYLNIWVNGGKDIVIDKTIPIEEKIFNLCMSNDNTTAEIGIEIIKKIINDYYN